ncbi:Hypothetical predicted protein [Mytilus galloprovincialis]|uniref:C-type lectin domain-containing protein n=1 Tax=Mytilus galloprovincialis TaxID=29158 RepID=A0A8B6FFV4_MYTGA|nr:Hypothetical predicted protein [Mytilus galloprovincialis]
MDKRCIPTPVPSMVNRQRFIFAGTDIYWIGATNCDTGIWIWSYDYAPLTYSNWNTGEPNNHRAQGEHCCHMYVNGKWNDTMCSRKAHFVCKRYANSHCDQR